MQQSGIPDCVHMGHMAGSEWESPDHTFTYTLPNTYCVSARSSCLIVYFFTLLWNSEESGVQLQDKIGSVPLRFMSKQTCLTESKHRNVHLVSKQTVHLDVPSDQMPQAFFKDACT